MRNETVYILVFLVYQFSIKSLEQTNFLVVRCYVSYLIFLFYFNFN
jgi:hypothetical protein